MRKDKTINEMVSEATRRATTVDEQAHQSQVSIAQALNLVRCFMEVLTEQPVRVIFTTLSHVVFLCGKGRGGEVLDGILPKGCAAKRIND